MIRTREAEIESAGGAQLCTSGECGRSKWCVQHGGGRGGSEAEKRVSERLHGKHRVASSLLQQAKTSHLRGKSHPTSACALSPATRVARSIVA